VLKYFHDETGLPVAVPYLVDLDGEIIPGSVLVESLLPGEVMHHVFGYLDTGSQNRISDQITDFLADLHRRKAKGFGGVELPEGERTPDWPDFWIPEFNRIFDKVTKGDYLSDKMIEELRTAAAAFPEILSIGEIGTLTHYDIWSGNVMIDIRADPVRVTGFIDIPGYFADYAREIGFMYVFGMADERFFERYTRTHHLDPGFALRLSVYALRTHLSHITMYPGESYYRNGAKANLEFILENTG
jgi:fructosamine-3-kinase